MRHGLIGRTLSHSYSKAIHGFLGNDDYRLVELRPEAVEGFLRRADFRGINVTIPYKEIAMAHCEPDDDAREIGCVNAIVNEGGRLRGHNTDRFGFSYMAKSAGIRFAGKKTVVLGSGGASKTAVRVARDEGAREVAVVSRRGENNYENLERHADCDVLVNATPVGMFPDETGAPVSLDAFPRLSALMDLVYNPLRTTLALDARRRGVIVANGLAMLAAQALQAHRLFFGEPQSDDERTDALIAEVMAKTERLFSNVALIGMPGCGKTSVGEKLAGLLGMGFVDTDRAVEETAGRKIPDLIRENGEPFFRELERAAVARAASTRRAVIATGGGAVLLKENRDALSRNCQIVFLERDLFRLATEGRPLSTDLRALFAQRLPIYEGLCDLRVKAGASADETAERARRALSR